MNKRINYLLYFTLTAAVFVFFAAPLSAQTTQDPITSSRCNVFTFDATGSYDPDNENISFFWDFGDGSTSTEPVVSHTYEKSGDYNVALTITDGSGMECSAAATSSVVRANIPPKAIFAASENVCANQQIDFNAAQSYDDSHKKLGYFWDFGDGTKVEGEKMITKAYGKGGSYKVSLTVDDNSGASCSKTTAEKIINVNEPPVADAGEKEILRCVDQNEDFNISFDGSNSHDINNDPLEYSWYFGDGAKEDGMKVTHKYNDVGNYDAKLVVKDNTKIGCGTSVDFVTVRLNRAPRADAGEDIITCPSEEVQFDGTKSYVHKKGTAYAKWFFGDGKSSDGMVASHAYDKPGKYQATLTLENSLNSMCPESKDTRAVTVNTRPSVSIKAKEAVCLGNEIFFDASSASDEDGDTLEYYWSFGDGTVLRSGAKVSHIYEQGGTYRVSVIVDDKQGTACSTATAKMNVKVNTPPVADAGTNATCCVDKNAVFDASASTDPDGDQLTYTWDFGDGTTANGIRATHAYTKSGTYNVSLTVDDNSGTACGKSTAGFTAQANSAPVPVMSIR